MRVGIISIFPDSYQALNYGITGRALNNKLLSLVYYNPRDYTEDSYQSVDDRPFGGGPGMVMKFEPLKKAITQAKHELPKAKVVHMSPQGRQIQQTDVINMAREEEIILLSSRYEGVDERLLGSSVDEELSLGDYVISGGELASMVLIDAMVRLLPGALGDSDSARYDSFMAGLLDCPHYTRPEIIEGMAVPKVLLSGNHKQIEKWRLKQALGRTWLRRPDLLNKLLMSNEQKALLEEFKREYDGVNHG